MVSKQHTGAAVVMGTYYETMPHMAGSVGKADQSLACWSCGRLGDEQTGKITQLCMGKACSIVQLCTGEASCTQTIEQQQVQAHMCSTHA